MIGMILSMVAGVLIALQSVFNAQISEKIGSWETTTLVHFIGLSLSLIMLFIFGNGDFHKLNEVNKYYLISGTFGVFIVFGVMRAVNIIGPTLAISVLIVTQLIAALLIETFGLFGAEKIEFHFTKPLGALIMIIGIIIFKSKS